MQIVFADCRFEVEKVCHRTIISKQEKSTPEHSFVKLQNLKKLHGFLLYIF